MSEERRGCENCRHYEDADDGLPCDSCAQVPSGWSPTPAVSGSLPRATRQPINHVDATPDEGYPLRILCAYRANCDCRFEATPSSAIVDMMNADCKRRAEILDRAILALGGE